MFASSKNQHKDLLYQKEQSDLVQRVSTQLKYFDYTLEKVIHRPS